MFDKKKVKEVAKLSMIELDDKDIAYFSNEIIDFLIERLLTTYILNITSAICIIN